jgi:hypothetical protein
MRLLAQFVAFSVALLLAGCATPVHDRSESFTTKRALGSTVALAPETFDRFWGDEHRASDGGTAFFSNMLHLSFRHLIEAGKLVYVPSLKGDSLFMDTIVVMYWDSLKLSERKALGTPGMTWQKAAVKALLSPVQNFDTSWLEPANPLFPDSVRLFFLRRNSLEAAGHIPDLSIVVTRMFFDQVGGYVTPVTTGPFGNVQGGRCVGDQIWIRLDYMIWDHIRSAPAALGRVDRASSGGCGGLSRKKWLDAVDAAAREIIGGTGFSGRKYMQMRDPMADPGKAEEELQFYNSMDYLDSYLKLK